MEIPTLSDIHVWPDENPALVRMTGAWDDRNIQALIDMESIDQQCLWQDVFFDARRSWIKGNASLLACAIQRKLWSEDITVENGFTKIYLSRNDIV